MDLKSLSDSALLERTESLAQQERVLLSDILHHLREIESRRLFSDLGFKSLFDYATRKLAYSEDQAARRISAMRLLRAMPEIEEKIASGALTLTNLNMANTLFRQEAKLIGEVSHTQKLELLQELENKSARDAEKIILQHSSSPATLMPDRTRPLTEEKYEIRFVADENLVKKLETLRGFMAQKDSNCDFNEILNKACDLAISHFVSRKRSEPTTPTPSSPAAPKKQRGKKSRDCFSPTINNKYISVHAKRKVWDRADGKCQNCSSKNALQYEHVWPLALGGTSEISNLKLLCRSCNQRAAIQVFGPDKMSRYFG